MSMNEISKHINKYHKDTLSKSSISNILKIINNDVELFKTRTISTYFPIIFVDCTFNSVKTYDEYNSQAT